ncbi:helix-turn-helix domain-containing protein [Paenibacillus sp. HJGM_3]|uniref:helix-turn-helix domain-containing protein n=1 Tax=Paenibacillus sp. HJGM_3 TaxID=3379816 RepID=UPI00386CEFF0
MTGNLLYLDSLKHAQFGKSILPMFIVEKRMDHNFPLHHHNFAELSLVIEGTGTEIINGKPHPFRRGTLTFLLPHHLHEIILDHPNVHKYNCMFELSQLFFRPSGHDLCNSLIKTSHGRPTQYDLNENQTEYMIGLFQSMKQEYENHFLFKDSALHAKLLEALVFLLRLSPLHADAGPSPGSGEGEELIQKLLQLLHTHFSEDITLSGVARELQMNAAYINRVFKRHVGQSFKDYLHALRIARATSLLVCTSLSILDISNEVGYSQMRTMNRAFKGIMGMTPSDYRDMYRSDRQEFTS